MQRAVRRTARRRRAASCTSRTTPTCNGWWRRSSTATPTVEQAVDLATARERLAGQRFDLVILDLALPDGSGLELLPLLGSLDPATPVLIFSAHEVDADVADRVASVLVKSQTSNRELLERIRAALNSSSIASQL